MSRVAPIAVVNIIVLDDLALRVAYRVFSP